MQLTITLLTNRFSSKEHGTTYPLLCGTLMCKYRPSPSDVRIIISVFWEKLKLKVFTAAEHTLRLAGAARHTHGYQLKLVCVQSFLLLWVSLCCFDDKVVLFSLSQLNCCGFTNYTDFVGSKFEADNGGSLPPSCCSTNSTPCSSAEAERSNVQVRIMLV